MAKGEARDDLPGVSIIVTMECEVEPFLFSITSACELCRTHSGPLEVIVVHKGIDKESERRLREKYPETLRVVKYEGSRNFGEICWSAVQASRQSVILFIKQGVRIFSGSFSPMLRYFKHDDTFAVSPLICSPEGSIADISLRIPYIKQGRVNFREWDWEKVLPCLPRPLITLHNHPGAMLVSRKKLMALGEVESVPDLFKTLCISAWQRGWRCYIAREAKAILSREDQEQSSLSSVKTRSISDRKLCWEENAACSFSGVINIFTEYYGKKPPAYFKAVISAPRRRAKARNNAYIGGFELAAAMRLRSAFSDTKIMDIGCGRRKFPGSIGVDLHNDKSVDIVHNLDEFPWPVEDESFDLLIASHIMEHVRDFGGVLLECYRILRTEGTLIVRCPHFSCRDSYINPTHVRHLAYESMRAMLTDGLTEERHDLSCGRVPFTLIHTLLTFRGGNRAKIGGFLAARKSRIWEKYWSRVFPAREVCWVLRKPAP